MHDTVNRFFEGKNTNLVQQNRKTMGREIDHQIEQTQYRRVSKRPPERRIAQNR